MSEKALHLVVEELASQVSILSARLEELEGRPSQSKEWLTVREAAALLNVSEMRIYQLRYSGHLTPVKRGRMYLFNREQVKKLL
jgi:excisionase family DNA binding protein